MGQMVAVVEQCPNRNSAGFGSAYSSLMIEVYFSSYQIGFGLLWALGKRFYQEHKCADDQVIWFPSTNQPTDK
jgi:hypothetical protein